ncbi:MAG: four helix bundle protein [Bacteroidetes bacterium GWF2_42_66]|nr:MAG: four helix bundle protein [Bacteroidetes bacterium GWA2_42_15]OFY00977.1 MAG: four helix bundle protein [Bacteroidetes bacterium GWE2_42_39]OFY41817.1 MAG: four helix bundle protein [Bacteroidetes bacterium GWF2_42_66]
MSFVTKIYKYSKSFPNEEMYGLISQIRRSAVSIPSNIAEGFGRKSSNDFKRFLQIAMGSLFEVQTQLEISKNLEYIDEKTFNDLYQDSREIERILTAFIDSIKDFNSEKQ